MESEHGRDRPGPGEQGLRRRHQGGQRPQPEDQRRRVHGAGRPVGLREVHRAALHRGPGGDHLGHHLHRRAGGEQPAAQGPGHRDGVPELCALSPYDRGAEPGIRPPAAQDAEGGDHPPGYRSGPDARHRPVPQAQARRALQRVAMGRAIVREPRAFLMDEPLSNLDAKLRVSMRASLSQLHDRLAVTTVYVTHDQVEAMTLGHRVCVLRDGQLQQVDTPQALYDHPVNLFVAGFIGSPAMNFVNAALVRGDGPAVTFAGHRLPLPPGVVAARPGLDDYFGREIILGIRPAEFEDASLADPEWARMRVIANVTEELGSEIHVIFTLDADPVHHPSISDAVAADGDADEAAVVLAGGKSLWTARVASRSHVRPGQPIELAVHTANLQFFDSATGLAIGHPGPSGA